jgi:hypothetical protein
MRALPRRGPEAEVRQENSLRKAGVAAETQASEVVINWLD